MKKAFLAFFLFLLLTPLASNASIVNCGSGTQPDCTLNDLIGPNGVIYNAIKFILEDIVTTLAAIFLVIGGAMIIMSAGDPARKDTGKKIVVAAIIGAFLALGAWQIINFILYAIGGKPIAQ